MGQNHSDSKAARGALALVGDFGGTNVRLALADIAEDVPVIRNVRHFLSKDFSRAADTIAAYLSESGDRPSAAVVAAAGPVSNGTVRFTNLGWILSETDLTSLGFSSAKIINDFVAAALCTKLLSAADVHQIGPGASDKTKSVAVIGPGTGFGASALVVDDNGHTLAVASEGGHASLAPDDDVELAALRYLMPKLGHVSIEHVLSGPGLCTLHEALNAIDGVQDKIVDAELLTHSALAGEQRSLRTVNRFCAILGGVAGNFALTYGALGGVYIAGGIAPSILPILERSDFRKRFESKGRFADYLHPIATLVITRADAAFLGAAQAARSLQRLA